MTSRRAHLESKLGAFLAARDEIGQLQEQLNRQGTTTSSTSTAVDQLMHTLNYSIDTMTTLLNLAQCCCDHCHFTSTRLQLDYAFLQAERSVPVSSYPASTSKYDFVVALLISVVVVAACFVEIWSAI